MGKSLGNFGKMLWKLQWLQWKLLTSTHPPFCIEDGGRGDDGWHCGSDQVEVQPILVSFCSMAIGRADGKTTFTTGVMAMKDYLFWGNHLSDYLYVYIYIHSCKREFIHTGLT